MLSAFKNFLIALLIAALVFGLVGYFSTKYLSDIVTDILDGNNSSSTPVINAPEETDDDKNEIVYDKVPDGNSFTMLFVGTDYRPDLYTDYYTTPEQLQQIVDEAKKKNTEAETKKPDKNSKDTAKDDKETSKDSKTDEKATESVDSATKATTTAKAGSRAKDEPVEVKEPESVLETEIRYIRATWIVLVRADKENREYVACYISPEMSVEAPCGESDLGEVYGLYGLDTLSDFVSARTGLEINYKFVLDGASQHKFADILGAASFDLNTDLYAGKKYHMSDEPVGSDVPSESESTGTASTDTADSEAEVKHLVLKKGKHQLGDYTAHIINTFKEMSDEDIKNKSQIFLSMVKQYLVMSSELSAEELEAKLNTLTTLSYKNNPDGTPAQDYKYDPNDPYVTKATLGTDFDPEEVEYIKSMLEAIDYFEYKEFVYPGDYSEETETYNPDIKSALATFKKYRNSSSTSAVTDTSTTDTATE